MAVDLGPLGIRANAIAPGFIDTRMALMHGSIHEHQTDWFNDVFIKHGRLPLRDPASPRMLPVRSCSSPATTAAMSPAMLVVDGPDLHLLMATTDPNPYRQRGLRTVINAKGPATRLSGGIMRPEVIAAMAAAAGHCVDMAELEAHASK